MSTTIAIAEKYRQVGSHSCDDSSDDGAVCAICFETRPFVNLPCACRIDYCADCWDRALAASVKVRGRAQCPSCRSGFHIDFNQESASLIFSKEEKGMTIADWRSRVYDKARPVQIRLLKDFGADARCVRFHQECITLAVERPATPSTPSSLNGHNRCEPSCICGDVLEKIDCRTRIIRMLNDTEPGWRQRVVDVERRIDTLLSTWLIPCDLCDDIATRTGYVWTCKRGPHTVLHPAAYDVCEVCFNRYAGSGESHKHHQARAKSPVLNKQVPKSQPCFQTGCLGQRRQGPRSEQSSPRHGSDSGASTPNSGPTSGPASAPASHIGGARNRTSSLQARMRRTTISRILGLS